MGTIHRRHRTSSTYSLRVLEAAIRSARPEVVLIEVPPDQAAEAMRQFRAKGVVEEARARAFPEYTDVLFPLSLELPLRIIGAAAWSQTIADDRRAALARIRADPARAAQWAEHQAAQRAFTRAVAGRSDDPRFVHTKEFDRLVAASRMPYARHFDADLGAGGWTQINRAHNALIRRALDDLGEQGLTVLITFGTAHKYKILEALTRRTDVAIEDTGALFA